MQGMLQTPGVEICPQYVVGPTRSQTVDDGVCVSRMYFLV